jgi:bifunctional DNase/RNase
MPPRALFWLAAAATAMCCGGGVASNSHDVEVFVSNVGVHPLTDSPVVVLEEVGGGRHLPIWIGIAEARSIAVEKEKIHSPRPNTHDLAKRLLTQLDAEVERVVVTELRNGTYFAVLVLRADGRRIEVDARPSDAIAIALRVDAPVFVRDTLLEETHEERHDDEEAEELRL